MYEVYNYLVEEATRNGNKAQELLVDAFNSAPLLWLPPKDAWRSFKSGEGVSVAGLMHVCHVELLWTRKQPACRGVSVAGKVYTC